MDGSLHDLSEPLEFRLENVPGKPHTRTHTPCVPLTCATSHAARCLVLLLDPAAAAAGKRATALLAPALFTARGALPHRARGGCR
ncbi:hypothetical protein B0H15DRAFT_1019789 [Mycena belliarum]|uniref:Uncharacterized protein n=1 Tax=Mycena belliarum TaxID=1033014 RepID=A0AAD6XVG7_9AGAR|nr:hypothetical protein B0H15DRAFT_1019789 [Mycena belliae]